ncbi:hypothetical protein KK141_02670 [Dyella sp. LX-66]|uniref:hypothetical protein n=1 Tax=unclassified Dyella TaxID=2634549 RepID=UPI001BE03FF9|nr:MULTISPECIES: hypothetical protein [unclassified Dyella]MBT2117372.1 hypothetical protein [Dyella sp. LX-1]MBT2138436.1 hypothetical protein [Dyella sp. LX-66]
MLRRFWFKLSSNGTPSALNIGCGITAYDMNDAWAFLSQDVFPVLGEREVLEVIVDVDVSTLDQRHVIPNMAAPSNRGVWFPRL